LTALFSLCVTGTIYLTKFGFESTFFMGMMCSNEKGMEEELFLTISFLMQPQLNVMYPFLQMRLLKLRQIGINITSGVKGTKKNCEYCQGFNSNALHNGKKYYIM
jgi:hypothetical protein